MHEQNQHHHLTPSAEEPPSHRAVDECEACPTARRAGAKYCFSCGRCLAAREAANNHAPQAMPQPAAPQESENASTEQRTPTRSGTAAPGDLSESDAARTAESQQPAWPAPQTQAAEDNASQGLMPSCHCGQLLPAEAIYCLRCGTKVGQRHPEYQLATVTAAGAIQDGFPIHEELMIGKADDCHVVLADDQFISRRHARIERDDGMLFLENLGSSNGTFLRVRRPIPLEVGDELLVGKTVLRLERRQ